MNGQSEVKCSRGPGPSAGRIVCRLGTAVKEGRRAVFQLARPKQSLGQHSVAVFARPHTFQHDVRGSPRLRRTQGTKASASAAASGTRSRTRSSAMKIAGSIRVRPASKAEQGPSSSAGARKRVDVAVGFAVKNRHAWRAHVVCCRAGSWPVAGELCVKTPVQLSAGGWAGPKRSQVSCGSKNSDASKPQSSFS